MEPCQTEKSGAGPLRVMGRALCTARTPPGGGATGRIMDAAAAAARAAAGSPACCPWAHVASSVGLLIARGGGATRCAQALGEWGRSADSSELECWLRVRSGPASELVDTEPFASNASRGGGRTG